MDIELKADSNFQYGIEGVMFRFYSAEEVKSLSVKEITKPDTFDALSQPTIGGLYDPALGPSDINEPCYTCGQGVVHCPGHLGHIELPMPTFNPVFFDIMFKMLKSVCFNCNHLMVDPLQAHIFICQCRLLDKGHLIAVSRFEEICGDISETSNKSDAELEKREIITKYTEDTLKDTGNSVVLVKNVEALRQELTASFISLHLKKTGKCKNCTVQVRKVRQEHKSKIILVGKIEDTKTHSSSKYSQVEKVNLDALPDSDEESMEEDEDDEGEPAAKRRKLKEFQKKANKTVSKVMSKTTEVTLLTALKIKEVFRKVWDVDGELLRRLFPAMGVSKAQNPVDVFFLDILAVPASRFRPISKIGDRKYENAQTVNFAKVLKDTVVIRELLWEIERRAADTKLASQPLPTTLNVPGKTLLDKLNYSLVQMQSHVNALIDSDLDKLSTEVNPGIKQLLEKKQGLFRKNMMGKRVNFAARSVISPDPNINTNEIGIPMVFAKVLTYPQRVTPWNVMELKQAVINGPQNYPGAFSIINEDGSKVLIDSKNPQQREALAKQLLTPTIRQGHHLQNTSKIVHRHLKNGDVLLVNRQPTLHRPSIQGHKARVLKGEKTLRLHYSNCKAYNADFDGDEMNAHLPQSEQGRSEGYNLALTDFQYLVPKDGTPLAGLIQDHMVSGVSLTIRGRYFNKADYCRLVYMALIDKSRPIRLLPPSILKPYRLWSGKQVLSTVVLNVIPEGLPPLSLTGKAKVPEKSWIKVASSNLNVPIVDHMGESDVVIRQGELLVGVLDKGHYGPTPYGLVHSCYELYGGATAGTLLGCFGRLFLNFLQWRGFSLGVEDILVTKKADDKRAKIIKKSPDAGMTAVRTALELGETEDESAVLAAMKKAQFNKDERPLIEMDMGYRNQTNDIQNNIVNTCMPSGLEKLFPDNNLQLMVVSGAKGSSVNCMQISCLLGQIELEGKRPPLMLSGKTLPSFRSYDMTPRAGGFVTGRFLTGIRQQEYFFHCMAGREGLVDTAVKTSRSGYLQRCIIKHLEGVKVNYDLTVRDSDNSIIQFNYGEDSLDILKTAYLKEQQYPFLVENHGVVKKETYPKDNSGKAIKKLEKQINKWQQKHSSNDRVNKTRCSGALKFFNQVADDAVTQKPLDPRYAHIKGRSTRDMNLCQMWFELDENQRKKYMEKYGRCPDPVQSQFSPYAFEALPEKLSKTISGFAKKPQKSDTRQLSETEFMDLLRMKVKHSMVEPGESVGLLCSQSIGEPSTQMTLNTFHFAGRGEMNVTLGIPRLREVLMVGSRNIKTPAMDIPINSGPENKVRAKHLQKQYTKVHLNKVLKDIQVSEWLSIKHKVATQRKRVFQITFNFLPRSAYKERYIVKPQQILNYMEKVYFKHLVFAIRNKIRVMTKTRLLSHETQSRHQNTATEKDADTAAAGRVDDDDDSDVDDNNDGDAVSQKEKNRHAQDHEYEDSDESDAEDKDNDIPPDDDVDMEDGEVEEEEGDLEENLIRQKEILHKDGRINAVLQLANEVEKYDFDEKKKLWCTITLSFPLLDSKFDVLSVIEADVKKRVVHQIPGLSGCYLGEQKGRNGSELHLKTEGINMQEIAKHDRLLDLNRLYCNDIHAVADRYGIEAASKVIIKEIENVFAAYGIQVDYRHLSLLADYMTFEGVYKPFNRVALSSNPSPLQKMTFETTMQFLKNASIRSNMDELKSPSAQIVLGKTLNCGTGCVDLLNPLVSV